MKDATNSTKRKAESDAVLPAKKAKLATESTTESGTLSTLWVGNLSWNVNDDWLKGEFEGYGEVISARVQMDRNTGRSRGFAYVEFKEPVSAQKALADTSKEIDGRAPRMDIAPPRGEPDQTKRAKAFNDKVSDPSSILFVGNLSFESTEDGIWEAFSDFGEILNVRIPTDRDSGQKKGFGYVEFGDQASATKAFGSLQGKELFGRPVRLDYSHPRDNNAGGGRGRGGGGDRGFRGQFPGLWSAALLTPASIGRGGDGRGGRGGRGRGSFDRGGRGGGFGGFGGDSGGISCL
jgi:nucleolin